MEIDVNEPKSKAVNVIFQNLKFSAYLTIFAYSTTSLNTLNNYKCASQDQIDLMQIIGIAIFSLNTLGLLYVWCRGSFARYEFWSLYCFNLAISVFLIAKNLSAIGSFISVPSAKQEQPQTAPRVEQLITGSHNHEHNLRGAFDGTTRSASSLQRAGDAFSDDATPFTSDGDAMIDAHADQCVYYDVLQQAVIVAAVLKELYVAGILISPLEFGSRQFNLGSNLTWVALLLLPWGQNMDACTRESKGLSFGLAFTHLFVTTFGSLINAFQMCTKKRSSSTYQFRFFVLLSTVLLSITWLFDLAIGSEPLLPAYPPQCLRYSWVTATYLLSGPIVITSTLLTLLTIRSHHGEDVRQKLIDERNKLIDQDEQQKAAQVKAPDAAGSALGTSTLQKTSQQAPAQSHNDVTAQLTKTYGGLFKK